MNREVFRMKRQIKGLVSEAALRQRAIEEGVVHRAECALSGLSRILFLTKGGRCGRCGCKAFRKWKNL